MSSINRTHLSASAAASIARSIHSTTLSPYAEREIQKIEAMRGTKQNTKENKKSTTIKSKVENWGRISTVALKLGDRSLV